MVNGWLNEAEAGGWGLARACRLLPHPDKEVRQLRDALPRHDERRASAVTSELLSHSRGSNREEAIAALTTVSAMYNV